jgi:tetratricopeptide (TPR) repeat protein
MTFKDWIYVAPHRVRDGALSKPETSGWDELHQLNMQRLARALEFKGCVAFVGNGASACLGYPAWTELVPNIDEFVKMASPDPAKPHPLLACKAELDLIRNMVEKDLVLTPEALQLAEDEIEAHFATEKLEERSGRLAMMPWFKELLRDRTEAERVGKHDPFPGIVNLPVCRFVTTNYDEEIERALKHKIGHTLWPDSLSFEQNDVAKVRIFGVSLATGNRQMVFHSHGNLNRELQRWETSPGCLLENGSERRMVLTDKDYTYWYLSHDPPAVNYRKGLDVVLQSNPILFIGYTLSDQDVLRMLRRQTLRWKSEGVASSHFMLLRDKDWKGKHALTEDEVKLMYRSEQMRRGVNLLPYPKNMELADFIQKLDDECRGIRENWRLQPRVREPKQGPTGSIQPRPNNTRVEDSSLKQLDLLLEGDGTAKNKAQQVVAVLGAQGSAKFFLVSQFIYARRQYHSVVFNSYHNDDVFKYLYRILSTIKRLQTEKDKAHPLIVIHNLDHLLGYDENETWRPRNALAAKFLQKLVERLKLSDRVKVLITARSLPAYLTPEDAEKEKGQETTKLFSASVTPAYTAWGLQLETAEFQFLKSELRDENSALILAANYISEINPGHPDRYQRLRYILSSLRSNSAERGTRLTRHVIRACDTDEQRGVGKHEGRRYEVLLSLLCCFNAPVYREVFNAAVTCCEKILELKPGESLDADVMLERLLGLGLVQEIVNLSQDTATPNGPKQRDRFYAPLALVKQYFRRVQNRSPEPHTWEFGLYGLHSRGPFNVPGAARRAQMIFDFLVQDVFETLEAAVQAMTPLEPSSADYQVVKHKLRALLDVLRSNFACGSVPVWGKYREYIDMLTVTIDLLRNLPRVCDPTKMDLLTWKPGIERGQAEATEGWGVASVEEMLYLYNELGLSYYQTGSVQDALSAWGLAFDWIEHLADTSDILDDDKELDQKKMYASTLDAHIGMAYLQMGRMDVATECFERSRRRARETGNEDLATRMRGMLARIAYFRGNVVEA